MQSISNNIETNIEYRAMIRDIIKIQEKHFWLIKDFQGSFSISLFNFPFDCVQRYKKSEIIINKLIVI